MMLLISLRDVISLSPNLMIMFYIVINNRIILLKYIIRIIKSFTFLRKNIILTTKILK